ncbi:MAG: penicillin-binding protein 2 [Magnetococcales bacterium]|nr:penicillin-binding protein 2 [Magnetococcales bacterium]
MLDDEHERFQIDARRRLWVIGGGLFGAFSILGGRLFYLQVMKGGAYRNLAEDNRISLQPISAPRGRITDRHGRILVDNRPDFRLAVIPELAGDFPELLNRLQPIIELSESQIDSIYNRLRRQRSFLPLQIKSHLSWEELSHIETRIHTFPGVTIQVQSIRDYPFGSTAAHLLGYINEVSEQDEKRFPAIHFRSGDFVGKSGMERQYEMELRGREGVREMEVNAIGRQIRQLRETSPRPGQDLKLTIDLGLQQAVEKSLAGKSGAVVAMDPRNGRILAMASLPSYNPNQFIRGFSSKEWNALISDPDRPLGNKAIQGQYPPGSTFKMIVALAAMAEGKMDAKERYYCPGHITRENHKFYCWRRQGHGQVGLIQALAQSCDVFFYKLAEKVGIDAIERQARRLGLGEVSHIALAGERSGLVPSRSWKRATQGVIWYPGETLITAIGQGYLLATPLQLVNMIAAIANGGTVYRPTLVDWGEDELPEVLHWGHIKADHLALIKKGLQEVVHGRVGTAKKSQPARVTAAGKTGTSQVVRHKRQESGQIIKSDNQRHADHALYVTYAPASPSEEATLAIAVVIEHGGHGSSSAAPVAKEVIDYFFAQPENGGDGVVPVAQSKNPQTSGSYSPAEEYGD